MMKNNLLALLSLIIVSLLNVTAQNTVFWGTTIGTWDTTCVSNGTLFSINDDGSGFITKVNFKPPAGYTPIGDLTYGPNGKLYGACQNGGDLGSCTLFSYDPLTKIKTDVYNFGYISGDQPGGGVTMAPSGMLYGVCFNGGLYDYGVIYSFNTLTNVESDIYDFGLTAAGNPSNSMIYYNDQLFGTSKSFYRLGMLFSFDISAGKYLDLYEFTFNDGNPVGNLMIATDNKIYGVTNAGGSSLGQIFSFDPSTKIFSNVYNFTTNNEPTAGLVEYNGILYGAASGGLNNKGMLYSFDKKSNTFSDIYDFNYATGASPSSVLTFLDGKLYGSTSDGGSLAGGVLFSFDLTTKTYNSFHEFNNSNCDGPPISALAISVPTAVKIAGINNQFTHIYPSPVVNTLNISLSSLDPAEIILFDESSREVLRKSFTTFTSISTETIASGVYIYELKSKNSIFERGKLIKVAY